MDMIEIESVRDTRDAGSACLVRWGAVETYVPIVDVRSCAEDLFTCAAYADLVGELLRVGLDGTLITQMLSSILSGHTDRPLGVPGVLALLPGGSSLGKFGRVLLSRRDGAKVQGALSPDEARAMGRLWLAAAEASEADTLFGSVLEHSGWMGVTELDALFGLLADIRSGVAEAPPRRADGAVT